jgi:hypothetical protein
MEGRCEETEAENAVEEDDGHQNDFVLEDFSLSLVQELFNCDGALLQLIDALAWAIAWFCFEISLSKTCFHGVHLCAAVSQLSFDIGVIFGVKFHIVCVLSFLGGTSSWGMVEIKRSNWICSAVQAEGLTAAFLDLTLVALTLQQFGKFRLLRVHQHIMQSKIDILPLKELRQQHKIN